MHRTVPTCLLQSRLPEQGERKVPINSRPDRYGGGCPEEVVRRILTAFFICNPLSQVAFGIQAPCAYICINKTHEDKQNHLNSGGCTLTVTMLRTFIALGHGAVKEHDTDSRKPRLNPQEQPYAIRVIASFREQGFPRHRQRQKAQDVAFQMGKKMSEAFHVCRANLKPLSPLFGTRNPSVDYTVSKLSNSLKMKAITSIVLRLLLKAAF
ncbi:hypothetical protein QBC37DRAFT_451682 [Rhypophila decipiens]|uniref:Uncharacterized protein n=1 Tax=Rhypophila decipiens TaxID=261697 RepID=A0AAN6YD53_9PEZI|nr:hypothetical protein QBC37DRAFT_451682 [Rhypophila decipiens]